MAIKPIEILIRAKDEASSIFTGIQTKITAVGIAVASFFGIALFSNAVKSAAEFEAALSRVKAAAGATDEEFKLLKQAAEDAGASTKYTSVEAAAALENLAKAGLNAKDSITALPAVLSLAQAGDIGLGQSAEFVTKAVMGMGLAFDQAGRVADVLAMGANASNTSVTGLAQALSYAAPVAHSLGLSLETTVAIIGKFADAGIDASRAGTALNAVLSQFSDPSSKFREELGHAGIITKDFEKALRQLAAAGPAGEKAILAVGLEAGPALRALLGQGIGALDDLKHKLDDSAGSAAKMALVMEDNLPGGMKSLGSAWDTVKNVLGAPVLPVLKEGVDQLSGALRSAVADGTVVKFGEAMAEAFRSGLKWAQDFLAQVNFSQMGDDMRAFATRTGEAFAAIGEYASAAGNSVKLVYGVMSAGANTVLGVVYLIGEAFAGVASNIQAGVALIMEGFAKVTFGAVSASFKAAAAEIRLSAEATWAASEALGAKSSAAFQRVADGAQLALDGFDGLANASTSATPAVEATGRAIGDMSKQLEAAADKTAATRKATEDKTQADNAATAAVANLKQQYAELMAQGNLQGAAEALQKLAVQTRNVADASEDAKARVEQAFKNLGMATTKDLDEMAARSKGAWETIKADGTSAASVLTQAFQVYAKAAIEAAGRHGEAAVGAVKRTLESEAAVKGLGVQVDETGKVIVKAMDGGKKATDDMTQSFAQSTEQVKKYEAAIDKMLMKYKLSADYSENQLAILEKENALIERRIELENKRLNRDKEGFSLDTGGKRVNMAIDTQASTYSNAKSQGLSEEQALKVAAQFINERGEKMGWQGGGFGGMNQGQTWGSELQKAIDKIKLENAATAAQAANAGNTQAPAAPINAPERTLPPATGSINQAVWTRNVNISVNNMSMGNVPTNETGDATIERMMSKLYMARGVSQ